MTHWTHDDPGAGDMAAIRTAAVNVEYFAGRLTDAKTQLAEEGGTADDPSLWSGRACDAWRVQRDGMDADLVPVIEALYAYHDSLVAYANEVEDIDGWARSALTRRTDAEQDLAAARRAMVSMGVVPFLVDTARPAASSPVGRATRAQRDIADAERSLDELEERRRTADRAVVGALVPLQVGDWAEFGRAMAYAGFTRPDQIGDVSVAMAIADALSADAADGDIAALEALLAAWGDSPTVLGAALERLGGENLVGLLNGLDLRAVRNPGDAAAVAGLQETLRAALAVGSQVWDDDTADIFTASLLRGPDPALAVAFLFGDPEGAPVAPTLVFSMADQLQAYEKAHGGALARFQDGIGVDGPMAAALAQARPQGSPTFVADPADSVFRQMVLSPRATLDWFADGTAGTDRIRHWYADRDWPAGAGYAAPLLVWESLQGLPGALIGPGMDKELANRLADVNSEIIDAWMNSAHRPDHGLDPEALMALAGVLEHQLPIWLETVIEQGDDLRGAAGADRDVLWMGADGVGPSARISKGWLRDLMAYVAEDDQASGRVLIAVERLQLRLMQSAGSTALSHQELANRCAELLGAVDRGQIANELAAEARADQLAAMGITVGGLALGEALGKVAGPVGGVAAHVAEDAATSAWASHYQDALNEFYTGAGPAQDRKAQAQAVLESLVDGWVSAEEIASHGGRTQYVNGLLDDYLDERGWGMAP